MLLTGAYKTIGKLLAGEMRGVAYGRLLKGS
jgi:hypothetical protein